MPLEPQDGITLDPQNGSEPEPAKELKKGKRRTRKKAAKAAPPKKKKLTVGMALAFLLIKIGVVAGIVVILVTVVGGVFICHTNDMYPAVRDGDLLITFRLGTYRTGDIVAYDYEDNTLYGRIVCEPGDEVYLDEDGTFTVNGNTPYEAIFYRTEPRDMSPVTYPYVVGSDEYFLMVDAREEGLDSRALGAVEKSRLKGKVVLQLRRRGF